MCSSAVLDVGSASITNPVPSSPKPRQARDKPQIRSLAKNPATSMGTLRRTKYPRVCQAANQEVERRDIASSGHRIRERFLHKLGIVDSEKHAPYSSFCSAHCAVRAAECTRNNRANKFTEPLKYDSDNETADLTSSSYSSSSPIFPSSLDSNSSCPSVVSGEMSVNANVEKKGGIRFCDTVAVHFIPMRSEYSQRIKRQLWISPAELCENANRNAVEFAFDGWDWRNVTEDDCMLRGARGELVHPAHCRYMYERRQRIPFLEQSRLAARQWSAGR